VFVAAAAGDGEIPENEKREETRCFGVGGRF
jgi:hypothetical protein